jgi:hypothetical protein
MVKNAMKWRHMEKNIESEMALSNRQRRSGSAAKHQLA